MSNKTAPGKIDLPIVLAVLRALRASTADAPRLVQIIKFVIGHSAMLDTDLLAAVAAEANNQLIRITGPHPVIAPDLLIPPDHSG